MTFNEKLIELRKSKRFSQEELGEQLGVTRQTVSKWELGQTTPEMDKLMSLSKLFHISIDVLVGNKEETPTIALPASSHYEYKSKRKLFGLPLVHVNIGAGVYKAKGIVAIGNIANGFLSIGGLAIGVFAFGGLSIGLFALGGLAAAILAFGGIALGGIAIGGIAVGYLAVGGAAIGIYSTGGYALAKNVAIGGLSKAHIAIGDKATGDIIWENANTLTKSDWADIKKTILKEYPNIWRWILNLFLWK
ncbi:hypothetical protein AGMMS50284_1070 [Clostridia bacterium]|nr:hypothetical protein AGMMS50284_1070 [Clostridia bacterium]